jgi:hypothetical protein
MKNAWIYDKIGKDDFSQIYSRFKGLQHKGFTPVVLSSMS